MIEDYLRVKELPNGARLMEPEFRLRDKLEGRRINEIFTKEKIESANELLDQRKQFFPDELEAVINRMRGLISMAADSGVTPQLWKNLRECAFFIRNQASLYGKPVIGKMGNLAFIHIEANGENFSISLVSRIVSQIESASKNGNEFSAIDVEELRKISDIVKKEAELVTV